jgi:small subunit ribosomal protein S14
MTHSIQKDQRRRYLYKIYEPKRLELQSIIHDLQCPTDIRFHALNLLNTIPRNSSKVRIKNRCVLTGRGRAILRFTRLSRIKLRELANQGSLMGIIKSSW